MESMKNAINSIFPEFTGTIVEHVRYPFQVENNIRDLEKMTRDLVAMKEDVKTAIDIAKRENSAPTKQIIEWLRKAEVVEKEAEEIQKNSRKRHRFVWSEYMTSKRAAKKLREMKSLFDKKSTIEVVLPLPPSLAPEIPASASKSSNLESALRSIKNDVHGIIGIWGMGGVGKTHLLKQVNNELCKDGEFNVVVFVTCSRECSEEKVQDEIIEKLKLDKNGNVEKKKITIFTFLNQRSFVLLLDDLWGHVDLETIGIPNPMVAVGACKRKVVLTTRSTEVCGQMEVRRKIRVNVLNWDDAWSLFKEKVTEETINSDPRIQRCAVDVSKELGGLPLALITVGRAMHDKTDPSEWEQASELLKKARLDDVEFPNTNKSVFHTLKFSYDSLKNDTLKKCFLHCSLWPEDHWIRKSELIDLWMGFGFIDENNIHTAYNAGYSCIKRLQAVCLLENTDEDDDAYVKMHDVIRDMALWIVNDQTNEINKWIVQAGIFKKSNQIEISSETEKLSLVYGKAEEILLSTTCSSTKLSTLLLQGNALCDSKSLQLEAFSELTVLDLSWNKFEAFPVEICKLIHLQFLNLSCNPKLKSLPEELKVLINLKYLLLYGNKVCTIPNGVLSKLKALRVLQLVHNYHVRGTEDNLRIFASLEEELQCLPDFQALGIPISNQHDFQKLSQTSTVPVGWLSIADFEVEEDFLYFSSNFLGNSQLTNNLRSLRLFGIRVKWVKFESSNHEQSICHLGRLDNLSFYKMANMKEVLWAGLDPKDVFFRLQTLYFGYCDQLTSISWVARLPCIRHLTVWHCRSMKKLICIDELSDSGLMACQPSFPFLKKMTLWYNLELESISDPLITFPVLQILEIDRCDKLRKLPFKSDNPLRKLKLEGTEEWQNNIELDIIFHKSFHHPFSKRS